MEPQGSPPLRLDDATVEAIAERVVTLLKGTARGAGHVDAAEVARRFGVSRAFVYGNAERLGAVRLGDGKRPRLRFDLDKVAEQLADEKATPEHELPPKRVRPRRVSSTDRVPLLPIAGEGSA